MIKWKYVFHRKIVVQNELPENAQKCAKIVELLSDAQLIKTVIMIGPYYLILVTKLIMNLPTSLNRLESLVFWKVHVRGQCFEFSPSVK